MAGVAFRAYARPTIEDAFDPSVSASADCKWPSVCAMPAASFLRAIGHLRSLKRETPLQAARTRL